MGEVHPELGTVFWPVGTGDVALARAAAASTGDILAYGPARTQPARSPLRVRPALARLYIDLESCSAQPSAVPLCGHTFGEGHLAGDEA